MTVQERIGLMLEELAGVSEQLGLGRTEVLWVEFICNHCHRRARASVPWEGEHPSLDGWALGEHGESADFCRGCLS